MVSLLTSFAFVKTIEVILLQKTNKHTHTFCFFESMICNEGARPQDGNINQREESLENVKTKAVVHQEI